MRYWGDVQPMKTLIHIHTDYSYDANISVEQLARGCRDNGIDCVTVTDHDSIEGARRLAAITDLNVIIGEEVSTRDGHLIGLFLHEWIRPGMSAIDTARAIREQGGLVLLPHPFVRAFSCGLGDVAWKMPEWIDAVEVFNGQNLSRRADRLATAFAEAHDLPQYVGADSHMNTSLAPCYQEMSPAGDPRSFLASLRSAKLVRGHHPWTYFASTGYRVMLSLAGMRQPRSFGANLTTAPQPLPAVVNAA